MQLGLAIAAKLLPVTFSSRYRAPESIFFRMFQSWDNARSIEIILWQIIPTKLYDGVSVIECRRA